MKCKDFRIEVEEGLKGESLSIVAQDHATGCRPCREFNQKHIEFREWLTVCRKVTAPKDFGFGVQRKIANTGASHTHGWAWNGLKFIVPTAALIVVAVLGWNLFSTTQTGQQSPGSTAAAINAEVPAVKDTAPVQTVPQPDAAQPQPEQQLAAAVNKAENNSSRTTVPKENIGPGGSRTEAAPGVPSPKTPDGIYVPENSPAGLSKTLTTLRDDFGAVTGVTDRKVKVVRKNSVAARSGIKAGDVVQGLNGNVVTIVRDGKTLEITLK